MIKDRVKGLFQAHRLRKWRIRTKLAVLVVIMAAVSISLYYFLWTRQQDVCIFLEKTGIVTFFNEEKFLEKLEAEAKKYTVPEMEDGAGTEEMAPFFDAVCDKYTMISIFGEEDGIFRVGNMGGAIADFLYGTYTYKSMQLLGEKLGNASVEFKNGTYLVEYRSYHRTYFTFPYTVFCLIFCGSLFLCSILIYMGRVMKRIFCLKESIVRMSLGDLARPVPACGEDEVGILAAELDSMRRTLQENIEKETESRKANQDLITAMSHDLRTPLTVLNGYLEVLRLKRADPEQQEEFIERCLGKKEDIRTLTDRMFEYALVFEENEVPELRKMPLSILQGILAENCDFISLAGFAVEQDIRLPDCSFSGDEVMLKRIFSNLFSNILKYGDKKAPVVVQAAPVRGRLEITLTNAVRQTEEDVESNRIGLKSTEKMIQMHQGEMYTIEENHVFTVEIRFTISDFYPSGVSMAI